MSKMKLLSTF